MTDARSDRPAAPSADYDHGATMRAWENLLSGVAAEGPAAGVRPEILASWQRCRKVGTDARACEAPLHSCEETLRERLQGAQELLEAATDTLDQLGRLLEGAGAMLLLCDASSMVIRAIGDARTRDQGREINLEVGGTWDEAVIGTNGIGTAIREERPTFVHASEHFCAGIKGWSCAAAPIRDPFGFGTVGAIDLSGGPSIFRPHNLALVAAAARDIEARLAERRRQERERLLEAFIDTSAGRGPEDGVVILDRMGRVAFSRNIAPEAQDATGPLRLGHMLVDLKRLSSDSQIAAALPPMLRPSGISRLILDGEQRGTVLHLPRPRVVSAPRPVAAVASLIPPRAGTGEAPLPIIGQSGEFLNALDLARRAAEAGASILIQGETGTGKELFARLVHASFVARKADAPFITMNCGAISVELVASELFGHVAGAFTGAMRDGRPGKFELAHGGVLCLDEIGEMPLDIQPYLLRVLEQRAIYRVGDSRRRPVDVQVVAMTNRDLMDDVSAGTFRRDLYYRISTVTIEVPPLRARRGDVPLLIAHFNEAAARRMGRAPLRFSDEAMALLDGWDWPGNVRELRNLCDRLHVFLRGEDVRATDLPESIRRGPARPGPRSEDLSLDEVEEAAIRRAFAAAEGNVTRVAAMLGISRPTLYRKMRHYGIRRTYE
ncbi:sigma-54-dependent Fis family transcriptional regulator [Cereibacter sphaeroides]|uniref:sigma-54-dependent Fis family transcriptional regulator n=1 Tax=Rhodobacterales TaxID=204455 RepID=UPI000BBE09EB|nr:MULTISPECIES: sigma-54-dependent Fis family transcriptional regulator [Paracoccaceae]MCE6953086.1 sigma-54-dependent Fis family transcriptional regulator [Cereibacter sphaeroides]MCE6961815.1 sigma-54-dependent Fis family transcriptional regulator [Cereibacter sphaeroides]MCE6975814.1 sigma-54-dependent Fis family transcriptional regulator [Cereibacter sphaeroides]